MVIVRMGDFPSRYINDRKIIMVLKGRAVVRKGREVSFLLIQGDA
jgi:hypothetical protein